MLIFAFILALLAVLGPDFLRFLLVGITSFVPVSEQTLRMVLILLGIIIITGMIYKKLIKNSLKSDRNESERKTRGLNFFNNLLNMEYTLSIIWILLIAFNGLLDEVREKWCSFMDHHTGLFVVIRFAGIIFLALLVGYCFGQRHKRTIKKSKKDEGNSIVDDKEGEEETKDDVIILEETPKVVNKGEEISLNISLPASAKQKLK